MTKPKTSMTFAQALEKAENLIRELLENQNLTFKDILTLRDLLGLCNEIKLLFTQLHELKFKGSFEDLTTCVNVLTAKIDSFQLFVRKIEDILDEIKFYELRDISKIFMVYAGLPKNNVY